MRIRNESSNCLKIKTLYTNIYKIYVDIVDYTYLPVVYKRNKMIQWLKRMPYN